LAIITATAFILQIATATRYGYFRDELYYLDCARHLAWGYVDQPPLIGFITWIELHLAGTSLYSLRFLPAVAGALTVWMAGRFARALGADGMGQWLAALAVLVSSGFLMMFHLLTMNAFEPLLWTVAAYLVVRIIQTKNEKLWIWFGVVAGIGILNKWSMLFFGTGLFLGIVLTGHRRLLLSKWIWIGFAIAMLFWLPNVIWNVQHHWPFLELMRNVRASGRDVTRGLFPFLLDQAIFMNPVTTPLWIAGAIWLLWGRGHDQAGRYRILGWIYLFLLLFFVYGKGKSYYLWPIYPMLFASGGVAIEQWTSRARLLRPIYAVILVVGGALLLPLAVPVLSPQNFIHYQDALHLSPPEVEHQRNGPLRHQLFADMFGWDEMAKETARAYSSLPANVREKTAIAASNYGEAGAIDLFGAKYGLPVAISAHQTYWFWGPRDYTGESLLLLGTSPDDAQSECGTADLVGHVTQPYSREDEHFNIYWCHPFKLNLQQDWPRTKHFN
jgi:4-amino-4-deoxy-L-arabinose transferase-like glycosyltransferase